MTWGAHKFFSCCAFWSVRSPLFQGLRLFQYIVSWFFKKKCARKFSVHTWNYVKCAWKFFHAHPKLSSLATHIPNFILIEQLRFVRPSRGIPWEVRSFKGMRSLVRPLGPNGAHFWFWSLLGPTTLYVKTRHWTKFVSQTCHGWHASVRICDSILLKLVSI